jgi:hypothetical protein
MGYQGVPMKIKKILIVFFAVTGALALHAQDCSKLENTINSKRNIDTATRINTAAIDFLQTYDPKKLELLKCGLAFVVNRTNIPSQIPDKDILFEVIGYLENENIAAHKDFNGLDKKQLEELKVNLSASGELTNDLYVKYMKKIDKYTDLKDKKTIIIKPEMVFPGYEKYLQDYKNTAPKTITGVFNFLLVKKLLTADKNDATREPRSAQKLYDRLRQLESALQEENKKSRLDIFGNSKRSQQISSINEIKNALARVYGEFITYYTALPPYFDEKLAVTNETNSVVFAAVALGLNTIVQELNNKVYGALGRNK